MLVVSVATLGFVPSVALDWYYYGATFLAFWYALIYVACIIPNMTYEALSRLNLRTIVNEKALNEENEHHYSS